jgi:hypothetical protein
MFIVIYLFIFLELLWVFRVCRLGEGYRVFLLLKFWILELGLVQLSGKMLFFLLWYNMMCNYGSVGEV